MKTTLKFLAGIAILAGLAYGVETTLAALPANSLGAAVTTMDQAHIDAINAIATAQNANNASLRASINAIQTAAVNCGATCSPTAGQLVLFNLAAGATATIPTSSGSGAVIRMRVTTTTTSAAEKVLLATTSDVIIGTGSGFTGSTAKIFVGNAGTYHSIQMPFAGMQPSGGFAGDLIVCTDVAAGTWACDVQFEGGTTPTTPYSTSTT